MTGSDLIRTRFTAESTATEVVTGVDLHGRRAIVTGGSSGIGIETARALASAGADVTLAVRDTAAGKRAAADIVSGDPAARVSVVALDLAQAGSVRDFASSWEDPLHMLVNNAGIMAIPLSRTEQGWEMQFATNHLGHFALATALRSALSRAQGARIVAVSSAGHFFSPVIFDDIHFERRPYDPWSAYGQSKTANILFAVAASSRWADDGIAANSLMPEISVRGCSAMFRRSRWPSWQRALSGRPRRRGQLHRYSSRVHLCSKASAVGTSSTAMRLRLRTGARTRWPATPWTRNRRVACGRYRPSSWPTADDLERSGFPTPGGVFALQASGSGVCTR